MSVLSPPAPAYAAQARPLIVAAQAIIFDVDGTLAETEELHRQAFNKTFVQAGMDWHWGRTLYKELLRIAGGKERIRAFDQVRKTFSPLRDAEIAELHRIKTACFADLLAQHGCPLRPGIADFIAAARSRKQRLAIATTTSRANIEGLLGSAMGGGWEQMFEVIVAGDEVAHKKPAPDVYLETLDRLHLRGSDCLAIEDSANGLISASRAGIPVLITRSLYFEDDDFTGAALVLDDLTELPEIES